MTTTATKSRPIIFTGDNVLKILCGEKTQTRRILTVRHIPRDVRTLRFENQTADELTHVARCPYGNPGDTLWVKESVWITCKGDDDGGPLTEPPVWYDADGERPEVGYPHRR